MAQDSSAPSTADVLAVSGGHPGNPWREQRLLFLYQAASESGAEPAEATVTAPLATAA